MPSELVHLVDEVVMLTETTKWVNRSETRQLLLNGIHEVFPAGFAAKSASDRDLCNLYHSFLDALVPVAEQQEKKRIAGQPPPWVVVEQKAMVEAVPVLRLLAACHPTAFLLARVFRGHEARAGAMKGRLLGEVVCAGKSPLYEVYFEVGAGETDGEDEVYETRLVDAATMEELLGPGIHLAPHFHELSGDKQWQKIQSHWRKEEFFSNVYSKLTFVKVDAQWLKQSGYVAPEGEVVDELGGYLLAHLICDVEKTVPILTFDAIQHLPGMDPGICQKIREKSWNEAHFLQL
jgi:hypothetical protein